MLKKGLQNYCVCGTNRVRCDLDSQDNVQRRRPYFDKMTEHSASKIESASAIPACRLFRIVCCLEVLFVVLLAGALVLLSGCGGKNDTPEQQVRRFVAGAEEAAEKRDIGALKKLIADTYSDDRKRTKQDLVRVAAGYFLRNKNVHIFTHIGDLNFSEPGRAELMLFAAISGQPIPGADTLLDIHADLYRFDMTLIREDNEWFLLSVSWRPAKKVDFFSAD